jgi:two-component system sensor histidine kinase ChiS
MKNDKNYEYSLLGRFISIVLLVFFCLAFVIAWEINFHKREEAVKNLDKLSNILNKEISENFLYVDLKILEQNIRNRIGDQSINYKIFNKDGEKVVIQSSQFEQDYSEYLKDFLSTGLQNKRYNNQNKEYIFRNIDNCSLVLVLESDAVVTSYADYFYAILPYKNQLLFLVFIICGLIYLFYNSILEPFVKLSDAALAISNGNLDVDIPLIESKEGVSVASALDKVKRYLKTEKDLLHEVTQTRNALSLTNLKLENKVLERTQELKNALHEKIFFFNNLTHEIKLPLHGIAEIISNLISNWIHIPEDNKSILLNQVSYGVKSLMNVTSNLLDIAKFSEGKINLEFKKHNLKELVEAVIEECRIFYMHGKKLEIKIHAPDEVFGYIDCNRLKQVLRNVVMNAIKFSENNSLILISIVKSKMLVQDGLCMDAVEISICDQGVGIPEDELSKIFLPFIQAKNVKNGVTGSGLGLSICKEIINAHHGKIWANNNKDGGAIFTILLPAMQPVEQNNYVPGSINLSLSGYNVLMIDDEEICLNAVEVLLYGTKYNLIKIKSPQLALKYLKENHQNISLIFIDLMMPELYGLNLISLIKDDKNMVDVPIILQTSSSDEDEIVKAFELGIFSFINKPYQKNKLLEEFDRALEYKG